MANKKADKVEKTEKAMPKTAVYKELATRTQLEPKQIQAIFEALEELAKEELSRKDGPGEFVIPNMLKLKLIKKPATPAGTRPDPFRKGQMMQVAAKPASVKVKPVVLKGLKDLSQ